MIKDNFSFTRMIQYGKTSGDILRYIIRFTLIIPIFTIIIYTINYINSLTLFFVKGASENIDKSNYFALDFEAIIIVIFVIIVAASQFKKSRESLEIMIPASKGEKFIFKLTLSMVIAPILFFLSYLAIDFIWSLFAQPYTNTNISTEISNLIGIVLYGYIILSIFFFSSLLFKRFSLTISVIFNLIFAYNIAKSEIIKIDSVITHISFAVIIFAILYCSWLVYKRLKCVK